jgi:hypothetical protein
MSINVEGGQSARPGSRPPAFAGSCKTVFTPAAAGLIALAVAGCPKTVEVSFLGLNYLDQFGSGKPAWIDTVQFGN